MPRKFTDYLRLMRLDRPIGIYLLLWPTMWALWLAADGVPSLPVLAVFVLGTVLMRSAGRAINDYADRDIDPQVSRTRDRPLAAGRISPTEALGVFVVLSLLALGLLLSLRNTLTLMLAVPAVLLTVLYPFTKRWLSMPQAVLGVAFSWGIPMAWAAVQWRVEWTPVLLLMFANLCWVIAYDTYYAMVDRADDLRIGVRSSAILLGRHDRTVIGGLQLLMLLTLLVLGILCELGTLWYLGLLLALLLAVHQQWITRDRAPAACFRAFLLNHYMGAAVFFGLALDRLLAALP